MTYRPGGDIDTKDEGAIRSAAELGDSTVGRAHAGAVRPSGASEEPAMSEPASGSNGLRGC